MSGKKYQIFISSTFTDLEKARETVTKSILDMYHIPIGMEMFSADNNEQWDTIKTTIDNSDYYVLIIGHRYGSISKEGISFTEMEHDYAKEIGVPILTFIRDRNTATTPGQRDHEIGKQKKLETFISKVSSDAMINYWSEEADLALKVSIALTKAFSKYDRIGWIRANEAMSPKVGEEMAILSKQNRDLKEQVQDLIRKQNLRMPNFAILFNGIDIVKEAFKSDLALIEESSLYLNQITHLPSELNSYVNDQELSDWNDTIKENGTEIINYNVQVLAYERKRQTKKFYKIDIKNTGNVKANNVVIELEFPYEIEIYNDRDANNFEFAAQKPRYLPVNPIDSAKKRINSQVRETGFFNTGILDIVPPLLPDFRPNYSIVNKRHLKITLDYVLHTQSKSISREVAFVILSAGNFVIKANIICEELEIPLSFEIPVTSE